jgi:outer membrane assembly lipoprotein YfiO
MSFNKYNLIFLSAFLILSAMTAGLAQTKPTDGTPSQRLEVARSRVDSMRKSISGAISAFKDEENKKEDKNNLETPTARFKALDKEASGIQSQISNLRGKLDRAEKYEISDLEQIETAVGELQTKMDSLITETAKDRANPTSNVGTTRELKKKKGKFLGLFGGGGNEEYEELIGTVTPGRDRELFIVATREVRKNNYDVGRLLFQTIISTYPDSPYLPMSKLAVADSFYIEGGTSNLIQAAASYQDWLTFFPTHPLADRVVLKIAECEMRQIGLPDREIQHARKAEQRLRALLERYPNTALKTDVEKRLAEVQDNLGLHNLSIANFYYELAVNQKKGGLKGAQSRYLENIEKYPNFSQNDENLYKLAITYQIEEETDQAAKYYQRIVRDYPNSDYVERAKEQLKLIGASIPEPNPEKMKELPKEKPSMLTNAKNQFFGIYPLTIDKDGVLMTNDYSTKKFEIIDQIIENQGDVTSSQIPKALTTVIKDQPIAKEQPKQ